mmetsp:Transcript_176765/g.566967  ORF Transcript_176765/g.566967 Transcript_176765/m.566967 type:complete len:206 (+) Transcript_176765:68-685(+)
MSVDLGGPSCINGGPPPLPGSGIPGLSPDEGAARALQWVQGVGLGVAAVMPGSMRSVPGDPVIARRAGVVAAAALLFVGVFGPLGLARHEESATGNLADLQQADLPQTAAPREALLVQARCLGAPQGLVLLHGVLGVFAWAQGGALYILAAVGAFAACALQLTVWHSRRMDAGDSTGLVAGQHMPYAMHTMSEEDRNRDVIMQNC